VNNTLTVLPGRRGTQAVRGVLGVWRYGREGKGRGRRRGEPVAGRARFGEGGPVRDSGASGGRWGPVGKGRTLREAEGGAVEEEAEELEEERNRRGEEEVQEEEGRGGREEEEEGSMMRRARRRGE